MNRYFEVEPEVACQLGEKTVIDTTVHPPVVYSLHCVFDGWLGDDLLEVFPCFLVTERLRNEIVRQNLTGVAFEGLEVSLSDYCITRYGRLCLPICYWMKVSGIVLSDDFGISAKNTLIVSYRAMAVIEQFSLSYSNITEIAEK